MPYFAYVPDGIVVKVERIDKSVMVDDQGDEIEAMGQDFLVTMYLETDPADYVQTFYPVGQPTPYPRGKYAGIGDLWDGTTFTAPDPEP